MDSTRGFVSEINCWIGFVQVTYFKDEYSYRDLFYEFTLNDWCKAQCRKAKLVKTGNTFAGPPRCFDDKITTDKGIQDAIECTAASSSHSSLIPLTVSK